MSEKESFELVDTHCHLTELSESELAAQLVRAKDAGVTRAICIGAGYGVEAAKRAVALAEKHPNVWASVGIHPHDAKEHQRLGEIEALVAHPRVVAIGETGLDFFRNWSPFDLQRELFAETIALALRAKKPLIIHCRDAASDCFEMLSQHGAAEVGGVFHCFSENTEFAAAIESLNFCVSFPGSLTFKKSEGLRDVARSVPLSRLMLETDSPYMAPEPHRGKPSEPAHVRIIAEVLAKARQCSLEEVARETTKTAERIFGLKSAAL